MSAPDTVDFVADEVYRFEQSFSHLVLRDDYTIAHDQVLTLQDMIERKIWELDRQIEEIEEYQEKMKEWERYVLRGING